MTNNKLTPPHDNGRIKWVDTAKALGIFLVFLGHLLSGGSLVAIELKKVIYSFHMPMYFILSGYVYKNDVKCFREYYKSKYKRILLPALILYLLSLPLFFVGIDYSKVSLGYILERVFYIYGKCAFNAPVWFFICIFEVYLVVKLLRISVDDSKKLVFVLISSMTLSYVSYLVGCRYFKLFGLDKCILGLFFFTIGILLKRCLSERRLLLIAAFCLIPIWIITGVFMQPQVAMYGMELGNFWLYIVSAISGSLVFFALCSLLQRGDAIREYSRWTVFIICSHYILVTLFKSVSSIIGIGGTYIYDVASAVYVLVMLLLYRPVCRFIEAKFPLLMGK